jgi:transketolase
MFLVPEQVLAFYRQALNAGSALEADWQQRLSLYRASFLGLAVELDRRMAGALPEDWHTSLPSYPVEAKGMATRLSSGRVLDQLAPRLPELVGGSADLTGSNNTRFAGAVDFSRTTPQGRYFRFGVREHAMGAILNGLAAFGGLIPYGGTFLVFSDYMRPAIRLAALSHLPVIYVFTHDSIGLGEDGPTHQPVEHLAALRAIPNLVLIRPADANEVSQAWMVAIENRAGPTALVLTRQSVPTMQGTAASAAVARGAYVLADFGTPELILMASGSEVSLVLEAARALASEGRGVRVVSFPSWELFERQDPGYRETVLPAGLSRRLSVEAGVAMGWQRFASSHISLERFGASAPYQDIFRQLGFTVENVLEKARELLH